MPPEIVPLGPMGVVVRFALRFEEGANQRAIALAADLTARPLPGQIECASALASVLVRFDPRRTSRQRISSALHDRLAEPLNTQTQTARRWLLPAAFGGDSGPQLAEAAALAGRSEAALVAELCATPLRVLALGFAPGQPYLGLLPDHWQMPRLPALTPRVEPGTITTALRQIVLFAAASPTGWRALGRTAFRPFQPGGQTPFPLRAGDEVLFHPAPAEAISAYEAAQDPMGGARCVAP